MTGSAPSPSRRALLPDGLLLTALVGFHVTLVRRFAFRIDDAFISFRYARNWADGAGLAYHPGAEPPIEGFSNFLWVACLALGRKLGFTDLPLLADLVSQASAIACVAGTYVLLRARLDVQRVPAFLGTAVLATSTAFAVYATSGLETAAFALAFFAAVVLAVEARLTGALGIAFLAGLAGLALALLRVEGVLWAVSLFALASLVARPSRFTSAGLAAWAAPLALGFATFLAFRHATFGAWVSNTVHAKADLSGPMLARGARTTASFVLTFVGPALVLAAAPFTLRSAGAVRRSHALVALAAALALLFYNTLSGGDWMPFFRFLVPLWPCVAVLAGLALSSLHRRSPSAATLAGVALAVTGMLPAFDLATTPRALREALYFRGFEGGYETELQRWRKAVRNGATFEAIGRALAEVAEPGDSIATGAIGAIGYFSNLTIHDRNGLVDPEIAKRPAAADGAGTAGHDKRVPWSYFASRTPTFYEATLYDPSTPFKAAARAFGGRIFARDPALVRTCIAESRPLAPIPGEPARALLVLRHEPDPRVAADFWDP